MRSPFDLLEDYERRSLAHAVRLPGRQFAEDIWRGIGYRVGTRRLVSDFREVVEIVPMPPLTPVPGAQPWLLGVGNLRGNLFPVVDLKRFMEGRRTVLHERQRVLIMRQSGGDVALTIDELYGQRSFAQAQAIAPGELAQGRYAHFIDRAFRSDTQEWGVFSLSLLSRTPEFRQAAA
ncbi:MAG: chemotaxis protein CheW [Pseudomonas sp.]